MNLIKEYKVSSLSRIMSFLFGSNFEFKFRDSIFSKLFIYENEKLSLLFVFFAIFFYWYEPVVSPYFPLVDTPFLSPLLILAAFYVAPKKGLIFKKFHIWYLLFLLVSAVSALFAISNGLNLLMIIFGWFFFAQFFIVILIGQTIKKKDLFIKSLVGLSIPNILYGLYQIFVNPSSGWSFSYLETVGVRASGLFGGPNVFALTCLISFLLTFYLLLKEKNKLYYLLLALFCFGVVFSFSRAGWFAFLAAILYLIFKLKPKLLKFTPFILVALFFERIRERLSIVFSESYIFDSSIDGRIWSFNNAFHLFLKKPFLGYGPGSYGGKLASSNASPIYLESMQDGYTALYTTDNQFTEILVQTGLVGFVIFVFFLISLFWELINSKKMFNVVAASFFIAWITAALFSNILEFNAITVPAALIFGMALRDNR